MLTQTQRDVAIDMAEGELNLKQIAEKHGICRSSIYHWKKENEFAALLKQLTDETIDVTKQQFRAATAKAFQVLNLLMHSKSQKVQIDACKAILDRGGLSVETVARIEMTAKPEKSEKLTPEEIKERLATKKALLKVKDGDNDVAESGS